MLRKAVPFVAAIAALAVIAVPAAAQDFDPKVKNASVSANCDGGFSGLGLNRVEIRPLGFIFAPDPREGDQEGPYYYLQSTVKLMERYGDTWTQVPTKKVRGSGQDSSSLSPSQDRSAYPVLKRKYPRRKLTGKNRLRAVKGTATLEIRRFESSRLKWCNSSPGLHAACSWPTSSRCSSPWSSRTRASDSSVR